MPQKKKQTQALLDILSRGDKAELRALFSFSVSEDSEEAILLKFNLWGRKFFPDFYTFADAGFHKDIDKFNCRVYCGKLKYFVNVVFRGGAKTTRTKLFVAFVIANDFENSRKFFKILTKDSANGKQIVTDIFNMLSTPRVRHYYPEIFEKTPEKREETMSSFTTAKGVKVRAGTVGMEQRGQLQGFEESSRPDFLWFDDFESRETLRSAVITRSIWDNMEEARTGLSKEGGAVFTCNYISERGNVHRLVEKKNDDKEILIVPIKFNNQPMWSAYTMAEINTIENNADDFAGEYMCEPSAGADVFFDRQILDRQFKKTPIKTVAGFKMFYAFDPSHRYGGGHDVAGGVELDSSTSVFIDFSTIPNRVVATFESNTIKPDIFGDEIEREALMYGKPIVAPENNKFDMVIGRLRQIYDNIYFTEVKENRVGAPPKTRTYGWNTNTMTKNKMLFDVKKAVEDGHLELTDENLINEMRSYSRDDLMDKDEDVRLTTRHFDLLMACAIAYQMRNWAEPEKKKQTYQQPAYESPING